MCPASHSSSSDGLPVDSPQRRRLPPLLRRAWYGINQAFRRRLAHLGVTPDQFTVIRTLLEGDSEGLNQRQLTHLISSDPNTVASLLERMESARLIRRKPHEKDRRARRIQLLPRGRTTYDEARKVALTLQAEILSVLPESQRETFLENLSLIADHCRQAAEQSPRKNREPSG
jgi:MarR family transcriptional regulator for hemolysin